MKEVNINLDKVNNQTDKAISLKGLFKKTLSDNMSEYELKMVSDIVNIVDNSNLPSTKLLSTDLMHKLMISKSNISYLITKIQEIRSSYSRPYNILYHKYFTIGTRKGLPSKQSIESDMIYNHPELQDSFDNIEDCDKLINLLKSYEALTDMYLKIIDSRRYDL